MLRKSLATIAALLLGSGSVAAATITIDFTRGGAISAASRQALSDLGVEISGNYYKVRNGKLRLGDETNVGADRQGLNSDNCGPKDCRKREGAIDSIGSEGDELVTLGFGSDVRIVDVAFGSFKGYGFDLFEGKALAGSYRKNASFVPTGWNDSFSFGARSVKGHGKSKQSLFKISSITIAVPAVPLPASALLLAGAVGGASLLRKRRQAA